jgi:hypothetical protein
MGLKPPWAQNKIYESFSSLSKKMQVKLATYSIIYQITVIKFENRNIMGSIDQPQMSPSVHVTIWAFEV